jgi:hypothetical protein
MIPKRHKDSFGFVHWVEPMGLTPLTYLPSRRSTIF